MKAQDLQFTQLLEGSKQFIIPIFQRTYSWEQSQLRMHTAREVLRVITSKEAITQDGSEGLYEFTEEELLSALKELLTEEQLRLNLEEVLQ